MLNYHNFTLTLIVTVEAFRTSERSQLTQEPAKILALAPSCLTDQRWGDLTYMPLDGS
jgi:hypothetical protein